MIHFLKYCITVFCSKLSLGSMDHFEDGWIHFGLNILVKSHFNAFSKLKAGL